MSFDRGYNRLNYRGGNNDTTYGWYHLIDSNNIGQQSVNYATSAGNADTVDGYHVSSLLAWECMARDLGIDSPFQASVDYFNSLSNLNNGAKLIYNPAGGEYTILFTRRNDATAHGSILKWGYLDNYIRIIRMINGYAQSTDWEKISAGYADSAGSVAWTNVSGRPTNISSFTNDSGYQTTSGEVRSLLTSDVLQNGADCYDENRGLHFYRYNGDDNTLGGGDGWILQWSWNVGSVGGQIYLDDNPSCIAGIRGRNRGSSSFTDWYKFLHTGNWSEAINYTSLGASGWSVATATKLQTSHTIWGQSFDGTGDLGGHLYLNGYLFM